MDKIDEFLMDSAVDINIRDYVRSMIFKEGIIYEIINNKNAIYREKLNYPDLDYEFVFSMRRDLNDMDKIGCESPDVFIFWTNGKNAKIRYEEENLFGGEKLVDKHYCDSVCKLREICPSYNSIDLLGRQ